MRLHNSLTVNVEHATLPRCASRRLIALLERVVTLFAAWTVAYHAAMIVRAPMYAAFVLFAVLAGVALWFLRSGRRYRRVQASSRITRAVLIVAVIAGAASLFSMRTSADDATVFHRAIVQSQSITEPPILGDTQHNVSGLPALSLLHAATSYEPLIAFVARALHVDPVWCYQNGAGAIAIALLAVTFACLYLRLRVRAQHVAAAVAAALLFLALDGNVLHAIGIKTFAMLWQGRSIVWGLLLPLAMLFTLRFLARPSVRRWLPLASCAVSAVGLSNSGVYLIPLVIAATSGAWWLAHRARLRSAGRVILANAAGFYCIATAAALITGIIPTPEMDAWEAFRHDVWWRNYLYYIVGEPDAPWRTAATLAKYLAVLTVLPLAALRPANAKWMLLFLLALIVLVANPIVGPFWIDRLTPATHWRLAYLFPIGLGAGLLAPCIVRAFAKHRFAMIAALVALAFVGSSYEKDAFFEGKSPLAPRIDDDAVAFGRDVREPLRGRSVLTDRHLSRVIGLIEPSVRLEVTRSEETLHLFRAAGREDEALRRIKAQALLNEGVRTPERDAALAESIRTGVNAIIVRRKHLPALRETLDAIEAKFVEVPTEETHDWALLIRGD